MANDETLYVDTETRRQIKARASLYGFNSTGDYLRDLFLVKLTPLRVEEVEEDDEHKNAKQEISQ